MNAMTTTTATMPGLFPFIRIGELKTAQADIATTAVAMYSPITPKDLSYIKRLPAVCDQPCIDISQRLREMEPSASQLNYLCHVYAWGYLQGIRGVTNWHGQNIKK